MGTGRMRDGRVHAGKMKVRRAGLHPGGVCLTASGMAAESVRTGRQNGSCRRQQVGNSTPLNYVNQKSGGGRRTAAPLFTRRRRGMTHILQNDACSAVRRRGRARAGGVSDRRADRAYRSRFGRVLFTKGRNVHKTKFLVDSISGRVVQLP